MKLSVKIPYESKGTMYRKVWELIIAPLSLINRITLKIGEANEWLCGSKGRVRQT